MSFSISFTAGDKYSALRKLHDAHAPASVKAVIEKALDHLRVRLPVPGTSAPSGKVAAAGQGSVNASHEIGREPQPCGVFVEAWGHIDESGLGESKIERFSVKPIFE